MIFGNFSSNGERPEFVVIVFSNIRQFWKLGKCIQNQRFSKKCKAVYSWALGNLFAVTVFFYNNL